MPIKALPVRNPAGPPQPAAASRDFDLNASGEESKKKALLVGVNYVGTANALNGCINDANNLHRMLVRNYGFDESNIKKLTEDNDQSEWPTRANIENGIQWLLDGAQKGDLLFFSFSGHGCQVQSHGDSEADGLDEVLCPLDALIGGNFYDAIIKDDWLTEQFHDKLPEGVKCICNFDCCHSGTMADLAVQRDIEDSVVLSVQMRGVKLAAKDSILLGGKSDPFLIIRNQSKNGDILLDQHNEYIKNTLDPTFKKFKVRAPKEGRLFIQCCDHDFKSTDIIGECTIDVSDLVAGKEIDLKDYKERPEAELAKYRKDNPKWPGTLVVDSVEDVTEESEVPKNRAITAPPEFAAKNVTRYSQTVSYDADGKETVENVKITIDADGKQHVETVECNDRDFNPFPEMTGWFMSQAAQWLGAEETEEAPAKPQPSGPASNQKQLWTISGCQDHQTSADATIQGQTQGAMTWALLKTLQETKGNVTYGDLLEKMKGTIKGRGFAQVPSISTTDTAHYNETFMGGQC